jgi:transcription antitermination factor NusG
VARKKHKSKRSSASNTKKHLLNKYFRRPSTDLIEEKSTDDESANILNTNNDSVDPASSWIIVELFEDTSLESHYEQIEHCIRDVLGSQTEYFIPVYKEKVRGKIVCFVLFEGYVFVRRTDEIVRNIFRLKNEHIKGALFVSKCLRLISGVRVNEYKKRMSDRIRSMIPEKGQRVIPKIGVFKNLEGEVLSIDKKKLIALVRFEKASRVVEAPINVVNLFIVSKPTCNISLLTH